MLTSWIVGTLIIWIYALWVFLQDQEASRPFDIFIMGSIWPLFLIALLGIVVSLTSLWICAKILTAFSII